MLVYLQQKVRSEWDDPTWMLRVKRTGFSKEKKTNEQTNKGMDSFLLGYWVDNKLKAFFFKLNALWLVWE